MKESGGPRQAFRLSGDLGGANFPDDAPPVDGRATVEERFSARPLTSDLGNSTMSIVWFALLHFPFLEDGHEIVLGKP